MMRKKKLLQTVETEEDLQISTAKLSFRKGKRDLPEGRTEYQ